MPKTEKSFKDEDDLELMKAVAQAWHARHNGDLQSRSEFDARRSRFGFKKRPTRFKLEAMKNTTLKECMSASTLDFSTSLFDYYEIVTLSKKLEENLLLEQYPLDGIIGRRRKGEGRNSLRSLFSRNSFKRFSVGNIGKEDER